MLKQLFHFLNPFEWVKAFQFAKKNAKFDKSTYDLELHLYSKILTNNMLHYGYFDNTTISAEEISIKQFENAQLKYAELIIDHIKDKSSLVLDVGCGMGGLSNMMKTRGLNPECLTPNRNQIAFINKTMPDVITYACKFEDLATNKKYSTIINSESLQYIDLNTAFEKVALITNDNPRWIITDYFRLNDSGINKSSHMLSDFLNSVEKHGWKIVFEQDITPNILPTLYLINLYAERFLLPIKHFAFEKLRFKKPKLFYMTKNIRARLDEKIIKETSSINPEMFIHEKKYLLFVLERSE